MSFGNCVFASPYAQWPPLHQTGFRVLDIVIIPSQGHELNCTKHRYTKIIHPEPMYRSPTCRLYCKAHGEASLARDRACTRSLQLAAARTAAEQRAAQWEAAESAKAALLRVLARRGEQAAGHAVERLALQAQRVESLQQQLEDVSEQLVASQFAASAGQAAAAVQRARGDALQAVLEVSRSEVEGLRAQAAAVAMEFGGTAMADADAGAEEAVKARDLEIMRYFDRRLAPMVSAAEERDALKALTREVWFVWWGLPRVN